MRILCTAPQPPSPLLPPPPLITYKARISYSQRAGDGVPSVFCAAEHNWEKS